MLPLSHQNGYIDIVYESFYALKRTSLIDSPYLHTDKAYVMKVNPEKHRAL